MRFSKTVALASLIAVSAAQAQGGGGTVNTSCTGVIVGNACQQAVDFFGYMAPLIGTAMTGGNTTIGQGGNLGGRTLGLIPKVVVSARVNAVLGDVPVFAPAAGAPGAAKKLTTKSLVLPLPAIDVAVGIFKGIPLGVSSVGGVDLLASASYVQKFNNANITIAPDKAIAIGYGLRVGLLQESLIAPGIGLSYLARKFPITTLSTTGPSSSMKVDSLDLSSTAMRLTVSKSLLLFGLAAGVGQDTYEASTKISATSGVVTVKTPKLTSKVTRTNYFVDVSMNLLVLKIVATGGMVSGGDIFTFNGYDKPANKTRQYASVGVRVGL